MTARGTGLFLAVVASVGLLTSVGFAQAPAATGPGAAAPGATRPAATVLSVAPADAWAVVGANNLQSIDADVLQLGQKLGLPIFFAPSGLLQMGLGIMQGMDPAGGIGLIVLDPAKYPAQSSWPSFQNVPAPVVVAIASTDPPALLQALNGRQAEQEGVWSVVLRDDPGYAVRKGGYVLMHPDASVVQALLEPATAGEPARSLREALPAGVARRVMGTDVFAYVNVKPIAATYMPLLKGLISAMSTAGAQAAGPGASIAAAQYLDFFAEQMDKLVLFLDLAPRGLTISGLALFQPDSLLAKVFRDIEPLDKPLLAGLPEGQFVLVAGGQKVGQQYAQQLAESFTKPQIEALLASGEEVLAEQMQRVADARAELAKLQQTTAIGVYFVPEGEAGVLQAVAVGQFDDAKRAWELFKQSVQAGVQIKAAQQPKVQQFLQNVQFTPEAETVDSTPVHTLTADLAALAKAGDVSQVEVDQATKTLRTLFGSEDLKVRIAVGDKHIVASLGGSGQALLSRALGAARANAAPLMMQRSGAAAATRPASEDATQPTSAAGAIAKVSDVLPKDRIGVMFVSVENAIQVGSAVAKALGKEGLPVAPSQTSAPIMIAIAPEQGGVYADLHIPVELGVSIRGMVNQTMMQRRQQQMGQPGTQGTPPRPQPAPQPEF